MARRGTEPAYSLSIPCPSFEDDVLKQLAQFTTESDVILTVYWNAETKQVILCEHTPWSKDKWYIQPDGYITDSLAEIISVKASLIDVHNLRVGHSYDMSTFCLQNNDMTNNFYACTWSDYACDHLILQGHLVYPDYD